MPAIQLTPAERKVHRAEAHHLDPIVMVGGDGLTPAVKKEADAALKAHGLAVWVTPDGDQDIDDAVMARSVIEAMFVCDHAYVRQITKEYERAEFVLLAGRWSTEATP